MTFKFKHTLAVILAVVTVACSVVGTLAVSAAETDSQPATEATVASDVTDTSVEPTQATEPSQPVTEPPVTPTVSPTQPVKPNVGSTANRSQNAVNAVKYIFDDNNLAVRHRLFYMCTKDYYDSTPGNFHSTQSFILQYENVLFFDRWQKK